MKKPIILIIAICCIIGVIVSGFFIAMNTSPSEVINKIINGAEKTEDGYTWSYKVEF